MSRFFIEKTAEDQPPLLVSLQNAARAARAQVAKHLLDTGLYAGQETIIELLSARDGQTLGEIAAALGVKPPTVTRTVTRLQEQGFVERYDSESDARQVHVRLTQQGRDVLEAMQAAVALAEEDIFGGLKKKERKQLAKILARIESGGGMTGKETKQGSRGKKKRKKSSKSRG